jgi:hypothetical protein
MNIKIGREIDIEESRHKMNNKQSIVFMYINYYYNNCIVCINRKIEIKVLEK